MDSSGHGWVTPRPDGAKAKCGGPALCAACKAEQDALDDGMMNLALAGAIRRMSDTDRVALLMSQLSPAERDRFLRSVEALGQDLVKGAEGLAQERAGAAALPTVGGKAEQRAFEYWARERGFEMRQHPLHYLFLDPKTDSARQGWNAALDHCRRVLGRGL